jgi:hypothetical protein
MVFSMVLFSVSQEFWSIPFIDDAGIHGIEIVKLKAQSGFSEVFVASKTMVSPALSNTITKQTNDRKTNRGRRKPCLPIPNYAT